MILSSELLKGEMGIGEDVENRGNEHEEVGGDGCHLLELGSDQIWWMKLKSLLKLL